MYKKEEYIDEKFRDSFFDGIGYKGAFNQTVPMLLAAAHQDDETIGAFSILNNFTNIKIVHTTDGAPKNMLDARREGFETREDYALQRRSELFDVLSYVGISEDNCIEIGVSDQETSYHLDYLATRLKKIIDHFEPGFIFTHAYEGGHPDHDSTAFAVHAACALLRQQNNISPVIIEFALYNNYFGQFIMNKFIPYKNCVEKVFELNNQEMESKKELLKFFTTQQYLMKNYDSRVESYRIAPVYDFSRPPHDGKVNYDNFDWGIKNNEWCEIARDTLEMFNIRGKI